MQLNCVLEDGKSQDGMVCTYYENGKCRRGHISAHLKFKDEGAPWNTAESICEKYDSKYPAKVTP